MPFPFPCPYDPAAGPDVLADSQISSTPRSPSQSTSGPRSPSNATSKHHAEETSPVSTTSPATAFDHRISETYDDTKSLQLSSTVVEGPQENEQVRAGATLRWVLRNSGTCAWPDCTTLRLVGGPELAERSVPVPALCPNQTFGVELVLQDTQEATSIAYALMTKEGRLFGHLLTFKVVPNLDCIVSPPACLAVASPMDGSNGPLRVQPGELRTLEWWLANTGELIWPDDMHLVLCYCTQGVQLSSEAQKMKVPTVPPSVTCQICINVVMPSNPGRVLARWSLHSPGHPGFSHDLSVEFEILGLDSHTDVQEDAPTDLSSRDTCDECELGVAGDCRQTGISAPVAPELLSEALAQISRSTWETQEACYATLSKIFCNIRSAPENPKFRRIPKTSKRIVADVLRVPGGPNVLTASGFQDSDDVFILPDDVMRVDSVIDDIQRWAVQASMNKKREERDLRIQMERDRDRKNNLVIKAKPNDAMKVTLQRIRDDQALLQDARVDMGSNSPKVERFLDKSFSS